MKKLNYQRVAAPALAALVVCCVMAAVPAANAAPTYVQAKAFTTKLMAVVGESYLVMVDASQMIKRGREVNALETEALALFGAEPTGELVACKDAAFWARAYWHGEREVIESRIIDPHAVNGAFRAGFNFGDSYRRCKNAVEQLDAPPVTAGPGKAMDVPQVGKH